MSDPNTRSIAELTAAAQAAGFSTLSRYVTALEALVPHVLGGEGHLIEFDNFGWGIEHPMACRDQSLLLCPVHQWTHHNITGPPPQGLGRYRIIEDHDSYTLEPA